ncbi:hypothetical protein BG004_003525 [Podila humilis]|nr:hypothetical protein BG004_003525 [Podila humilis]
MVVVVSAAPFEQLPFKSHSAGACAAIFGELQPIFLNSVTDRVSLSTKGGENKLVGGSMGDKSFEPVKFSFVPYDAFGRDQAPSHTWSCLQNGFPYRVRVEGGGMNGYIKRDGNYLVNTPSFYEALPIILQGDGYDTIELLLPIGRAPLLWTLRGPGESVLLEEYSRDEGIQKFRISTQSQDNNIRHENSNLNTLVSKPVNNDLIVGGPKSADKNYKQLELCVVSSDYGCSTEIKSNCIYQDIPYRIRVNSPVEGYLRITGQNTVEIVHSFADASRLNLYKEAGWGLRIAHLKDDGTRIVFSATKEGYPIVLEEAVTNAARQWFTLIETN